jgi:hypothetical protein
MFPGVDLLIQRIIYILTILLMLIPSSVLAQNLTPSLLDDKKGIYAIVKDGQGEAVEGFLRLSSEELTVRTKENKERSIPVKYIKSITLEEIKSEVPGEDSKKQATYKVRLENSREIYTLKKKYSFSLNTKLGLVTKTIDPEMVNNIFNKETSPSVKTENEKPFIQDKSVVFSLEFKFWWTFFYIDHPSISSEPSEPT